MGNLSYGNQGSSYYDLSKNRQVFAAYAAVTAPVLYSTAAGTGGPLLWNNTQNRNAILLAVTCAVGVVSTVAGALGITGNIGQTAAPTSTTTITASGNLFVGGPAPACNVYNVGTVANAGNFFLPLIQVGTGAITTNDLATAYIPIDGMVVVPPGAWAAVAASATASSLQAKLGLVWAEIPI